LIHGFRQRTIKLYALKKIGWILALIVVFFIGDRIGGFVLKKLTEKSQFRYTRLYTDQAKADILLLGNSRGLIFYEPYIEEISNQSTFNLSYNGLPIDLGKVLVQDYLDLYPAPKTLIIDITMCDRTNNNLIAGFNPYARYSKRMSQLIRDSIPTSSYGGALTHLYRYNSEVFQRALFYISKSDKDWLNDREMNQFLIDEIKNTEPYEIDLQEKLLNELKETIQAAKAKGVKVHLVINPYFPPFADKITNLSTFKKRIENATGERVWDYSKIVTDYKAFSDYQHLNKVGARVLIDQMKVDGLFGSSLGD